MELFFSYDEIVMIKNFPCFVYFCTNIQICKQIWEGRYKAQGSSSWEMLRERLSSASLLALAFDVFILPVVCAWHQPWALLCYLLASLQSLLLAD